MHGEGDEGHGGPAGQSEEDGAHTVFDGLQGVRAEADRDHGRADAEFAGLWQQNLGGFRQSPEATDEGGSEEAEPGPGEDHHEIEAPTLALAFPHPSDGQGEAADLFEPEGHAGLPFGKEFCLPPPEGIQITISTGALLA